VQDEKTLYSARLARRSRSLLYRLRWYGHEDETFFIERKEHNDRWSGFESSKRRFAVHSVSELSEYFDGKVSMQWDCVDEDRTQSSTHLATEIRQAVAAQRLLPSLRTEYIRRSWHEPVVSADAQVRVTLDTQLRLVRAWHFSTQTSLLATSQRLPISPMQRPFRSSAQCPSPLYRVSCVYARVVGCARMRCWFTTHWCLFQVREEDVGQPIAARAAQSRYHCDNSAKGELSIGAPMPFVDFGYSILEIKVRSLKPAALLCESPCPLRHMLQYLRVSARFSAHEYSLHQAHGSDRIDH
jgi:SPX domain protein involved in polyphosphate accumulation